MPSSESCHASQIVSSEATDCFDDDDDDASSDLDPADPAPHTIMYRRPSNVAYGPSRPVIDLLAPVENPHPNKMERMRSREAERELLRDNHMLSPPADAHRRQRRSFLSRLYSRVFALPATSPMAADGDLDRQPPSETSPLLRSAESDTSLTPSSSDDDVEEQWDAALATGELRTNWRLEAKTITAYSAPLLVTYLLQYSVNVASVFAVGRLGKEELAAVSIASMTAVITCYAPFIGLATSLDTLCAQAFGSGHKRLVGLHLQRLSYFLLLCFIPISFLWYNGEILLSRLVPDPRTAELGGIYLRVLIAGGPAMALFEGGKRYVQAQGLFQATTWVLLIAAPLNFFLMWLLVWKLELGFVGAPIAVATTDNLLPILLFLYVYFIDGSQCWGGFSKRALTNWGQMIRLAIPGMVMIEAEYLAFELLTLLASRFGTTHLAAQSVVMTLTSITYQIPFTISVASSTRIANLIGAGLVSAAKTSAVVTIFFETFVGLFNFSIMSLFRPQLAMLFTQDPEVVELASQVLIIVAAMQVFDGMSAGAHGTLRGIGRQYVGGYTNLAAYYVVALPISVGTAFGLGWGLWGLWLGVTIGLVLVTVVEYLVIFMTDWGKVAKEAEARNAQG